MSVKHKRLGKNGVLVSNLCLGTMNFGWHTSEEDSFKIMDRALELGINFSIRLMFMGGPWNTDILRRSLEDGWRKVEEDEMLLCWQQKFTTRLIVRRIYLK